jgi:phosphoglycolate phosphatase
MAVIFDLDGTLLNSLPDIAAAMDHVLGTLGLPTRTMDEYERFIGDGARALVRRSIAPRLELEDEALEAFRARYFANLTIHTRPYDGIAELLAALAARGVPTAVLSNKPHPATVALVQALFPSHRFAAVVGEQEGTPRKPSPDGALALARLMNVAPHEVRFVGDTPIDVHTARAAGMIPVGVLWGMRSREELEGAGADCVIARPEELLARL